jgi:predicted DCC family thiol-disulfide oxidoreductase YuxK
MSGEPVLHVVYDGQCAFCIRSLRVCRALVPRGRLRFHDANDRAAVTERFPALRDADLDDAMYTVGSTGEVHRGFFAFRRIVRSGPLMWPLLPFLHWPGASLVGPSVYAWVARHRRRFGCRVGSGDGSSPLDEHSPPRRGAA